MYSKQCGTWNKRTQSTQHIPFGKDGNIFSNYKQIMVKNAQKDKKLLNTNKFNILISFIKINMFTFA